jgi:hypothetical protein
MANETRMTDREAHRARIEEAAAIAMERPLKNPDFEKVVARVGDKLVVKVVKKVQQ